MEDSDPGMADLVESKHLAETFVRIRDCHVWTAIYYLDSPTDYREYLPKKISALLPLRYDIRTLALAILTPDRALTLLFILILLGWLFYIADSALWLGLPGISEAMAL